MERLAATDACVDAVIDRVGKELHMAAPLALGKPNHLLNAFYRRAKADPSVSLNLYTALTLQRPTPSSDLERRFLEPFVERIFGDYPDLEYELDRVAGKLPANVRVYEFYFPAGKYSGNSSAQRDYISSNYTHVARDLLDRGINVLVQQVAVDDPDNPTALSLSCNADVSLDLMAALGERADGPAVAFVAQVNRQLPFMYGDAVLALDAFHYLLDVPGQDYRLFGPPRMSVPDPDHMIGLYASTLIKDGGELQIGIGALGDAITYGLILRNEHNDVYRRALDRLGVHGRFGTVVERLGDTAPFEQGLFAATEMLVDGFMHLFERGIVRRRVYDDVAIQRLLNQGRITEAVTADTLAALLEHKAIHPLLSDADVTYLKRFGILRQGVDYADGHLITPDGERLLPDVLHEESRDRIVKSCLGSELQNGAVIHAGFFIGPQAFYDWLRDMPEDQRRLIHMKSISRINQLYGHEALDRLHRRNGRFVNTGMMVTLSGAVVSDALEDGTVISGVGGQYNFVAMAQALPDGHSILQIRATRESHGKTKSNVVWNYGHITIPRHLRDIIVTEYGIADLRGKTDEEVIQQLLNVTDSRFQQELLAQAKQAGKLCPDYQIPPVHRRNLPEHYEAVLAQFKADGFFARFPFGTDLTAVEIVLGKALRTLKAKIGSAAGALDAVADAVVDGAIHPDVLPYLERMGLDKPSTLKESLYQRILAAELRNEGVGVDLPKEPADPLSGAKEAVNMTDTRHILVPTDFSEGADEVLAYATSVAQQLGAELHLLHVCPLLAYALGSEISPDDPSFTQRVMDGANENLKKRAAAAPGDVKVSTKAVEGSPARKIIDEAKAQNADMIVMATHGRTGVDHLLLGSVAEKVVRLSPVPVLTLRPGQG